MMPATLVTIAGVLHAVIAPNGVQWSIGERVGIWDAASYNERVIVDYHPGSWDAAASCVRSAYFAFEDGWLARPHLLVKAGAGQLGEIARAFAPRYARP